MARKLPASQTAATLRALADWLDAHPVVAATCATLSGNLSLLDTTDRYIGWADPATGKATLIRGVDPS